MSYGTKHISQVVLSTGPTVADPLDQIKLIAFRFDGAEPIRLTLPAWYERLALWVLRRRIHWLDDQIEVEKNPPPAVRYVQVPGIEGI